MDDFAQRMSQMQEEVKAALEHAADEMAWYYNHWRSPTPVYEVRGKVWLNTQNYTTTHPTKKLDHKWLGPFVIEKVVSPATVKLRLSLRERGVHPVISISNIRPYLPDPIPEHPLNPRCRRDNSSLWSPPMESIFLAQKVL